MARKAAGLTQEDAAGLLNVTVRAYQNYESVRVPFRRLSDIARITGRDEDWLLRGDPKPGASLAEVREELAAVRGQLAEVLRRLPEAPGQPHAETN